MIFLSHSPRFLLYIRAMKRSFLRFLFPVCFCKHRCSAQNQPKKKLLLLAQGPDGHPAQTHEYVAGLTILQKLLEKTPTWTVTLCAPMNRGAKAPTFWPRRTALSCILSEVRKWSQQNPKRAAALAALAKRGGGISVLHWAMGTKDAKNIEPFLQLAGGCHGGP